MINDFFSAFPGTLNDQMRALFASFGADPKGAINDMALQFLTARGFGSGTVEDGWRLFLLSYLAQPDVGQTTQDLWTKVTGPFTGP